MRFFEFELTERRMADLYHNSNDGDKILRSGQINVSMPDKDIMDEPTEQEREIGPKISLTRDFHYDWAPHKFVIDQAKLASRQKIIPIDTQNPTYDERRVESEEYVLKPIPLDMIKAVILPDINKGYLNNLEVARLALAKNIPVYVGSHPRKLTQITADDVDSGPPKGAYAVVTDPGFSPFEEGDYLTKAQLKAALDDDDDGDYDFEYDILESVDTSPESQIDMHRAFEYLTDRQREVLTMRFKHNMTYKEIGKELGVSSGRVEQILKRILRQLRHPVRGIMTKDQSDDFTKKEYERRGWEMD